MTTTDNNDNTPKPKKKLTLTPGSVKLDMSRALDRFEQHSKPAADSATAKPHNASAAGGANSAETLTSHEINIRMQALQDYKSDGTQENKPYHAFHPETKSSTPLYSDSEDSEITSPSLTKNNKEGTNLFDPTITPNTITNPILENKLNIKVKSVIEKGEKSKSSKRKEPDYSKEVFDIEEDETEKSKKAKKDKLLKKVDLVNEGEDEVVVTVDDDIDIHEYEMLYGRHINVKSAQTPLTTPKKFTKSRRSNNQRKYQHVKINLELGPTISVKDLAHRAAINVKSLLSKISQLGIAAAKSENSVIDRDTAALLMLEYGHIVHNEITEFEKIIGSRYINMPTHPRPPVVAVMGHIDHGKTSLLDKIRNTNITANESGGITQHIGAYQVETPKGIITFLDTPGHQAFFKMRERGAEVTDIVIIVIAVDDGIMQQTIEAIEHAKNADLPIIIAANKIDNPTNNIAKIKNDLMQHNVVLEEFGGETIIVPISAKTGENIDLLLDTILLQAEINELKSYDTKLADGMVIETKIMQDKGPMATVLIQNGILRKGDIIVADECYGRVRKMQDSNGQEVIEATPSMPVEVTGFGSIPQIGQRFYSFDNDNEAKTILKYNIDHNRKLKEAILKSDKENAISNIEELFAAHAMKKKTKEMTLILKADTLGSLEAISSMFGKIKHPEIALNILAATVGPILESDIKIAQTTKAVIFAYNVKVDKAFQAMADKFSVPIYQYQIIYDLESKIKELLSDLLEPERKEELTGRATVRQIFPVSKTSNIAGCYVNNGSLKVGMVAKIIRNNTIILETKIANIRYLKDEVKEATTGHECGIKLANSTDIAINDIIETYLITYEKRFIH